MTKDRIQLEEPATEVVTEPDFRNSTMLYEDELELVRRIDWRFLLPDPNLKTVAYIGPEEKPLTAALKRFADNLVILGALRAKGSGQEHGQYDVLASRADIKQTTRACSKLRAGGYLYWEIERTSLLSAFGSPKVSESARSGHPHFSRYIEILENSGFRDVSVHWHRPDFENCLDIVPLNSKAALEHFFSRDSADIKGQLKRVGGLVLNKTGLVNRLAPCISLTASKVAEAGALEGPAK